MKARHAGLLPVLASTLGAGALRAQGATPTHPLAVHLEAMAFDHHRNRLVLFGGGPGVAGQVVRPAETWEWTGDRWEIGASDGAGPIGRAAHGMGYDESARTVVLYGGVRDTAFNKTGVPLCDTWFYKAPQWTRASNARCVTERAFSFPLHDVTRNALLLFEGGGETTEAERPTRLWRWENDDWWLIDSAGPRRGGLDRVVYDRERSVFVAPVFSGPDKGMWEWNGRVWRRATTEMPAARTRYALAYDSKSHQVLLIGGRGGRPAGPMTDAWMWNGTVWTEVREPHALTQSAPPARMSASFASDPVRHRLFLFGGVGSSGVLDELWVFEQVNGWRRVYSPR